VKQDEGHEEAADEIGHQCLGEPLLYLLLRDSGHPDPRLEEQGVGIARSLGGFESRECRMTDERGALSGFRPGVGIYPL